MQATVPNMCRSRRSRGQPLVCLGARMKMRRLTQRTATTRCRLKVPRRRPTKSINTLIWRTTRMTRIHWARLTGQKVRAQVRLARVKSGLWCHTPSTTWRRRVTRRTKAVNATPTTWPTSCLITPQTTTRCLPRRKIHTATSTPSKKKSTSLNQKALTTSTRSRFSSRLRR